MVFSDSSSLCLHFHRSTKEILEVSFLSWTSWITSNKLDLVTRLEQAYSGHRLIFFTYIFKLLCQLAVCIASFAVTSLFFLDCELAFSFCCPDVNICVTPEASNITCSRNITDQIPEGWPLTINVPCIYTSLTILNLARYADVGLLVIAGYRWFGLVLF